MKKFLVPGVALVLVVGGMGALYVWYGNPFTPIQNTETTQETLTPQYIVKEIPVAEGAQTPNLERAVVFSADLPEEARTIITMRIEEARSVLREDPTQGGAWLDLGVLYHSAGDTEGAREVWEFLVEVLPEDTVAYDNLGKLNHYTLRDYPRAEFYFLESKRINPNLLTPYIELHSLYRYSYKTNTRQAVTVLEEAMARFPTEFSLYGLLANYYRDRGETAEARRVLEEGINKAREAGNVDAIAALGSTLQSLSR